MTYSPYAWRKVSAIYCKSSYEISVTNIWCVRGILATLAGSEALLWSSGRDFVIISVCTKLANSKLRFTYYDIR